MKKKPEIILVDRGFVDFRFWNYFYQEKGKATPEEVQTLQHKPIFQNRKLVPDLFIALTVSIEEAIKRNSHLRDKIGWVLDHNSLFDNFYNSYKGPKQKIDTSNLTMKQVFNLVLGDISLILPIELRKKIQESPDLDSEL